MTTAAAQPNANANNDRHPPLFPTDGDAVVPAKKEQEKQVKMGGGRRQKVDKQSSEYLMKSMLAGGIAGCAVRRNGYGWTWHPALIDREE